MTGEDYSLGEIIHHELLDEKNVTFAGVLPPHPLIKKLVIKVRAQRIKPERAFIGGLEKAQANAHELLEATNEGIQRWGRVKFCPKCGTRLKLKQIKLEKGTAITYVCDNCGFSDKAGKTVMQATEEELADAPTIKVLGEKESKLTASRRPRWSAPSAAMVRRCGGSCRRGAATSHRRSSTGALKCNHTWRSYS